jgi:hypothetical protein
MYAGSNKTERQGDQKQTAHSPAIADAGSGRNLGLNRTVAPRPDRAGKVAMTTRVPRRLRKTYELLKAQLDDATMEELQTVALRAFLPNFRGVPRAELQPKWEALRLEFGNKAVDGFGDD